MEEGTDNVINIELNDNVPKGEIWFIGPYGVTILKGFRDANWPWNTLGLSQK